MSETLSSVEHLVRRHPSGTVLFREGDRGQTMYVIRSGKVNISKRIGDSEITLAVLGAGEFFGEMALLEGLPRSAGATVVEEALLIEVAQGAFATVVRRNSEIAVRLMRRLSSRLREADRQIQALMSRSRAARALSLVRNLAGAPDAPWRRVLPDDVNPQALMKRVGLSCDEALRVEPVFAPSRLLLSRENGRLAAGPLPGQAGAKPAESKPPPARPTIPAKPARGGAVPLPGFGEAAAPSPSLPDLDPPATPGAVALPGLDEPQRTAMDFRPRPPVAALPGEGTDAVPLPGFDGARAAPPPPPADDPFAAIDVERPASGGAPPPPPSQPPAGDAFAADLPEIPAPPLPSSAAKQEEAMNFDFVESKPKSPSVPDMLDFVDDAPRDPDRKKRPPPPVVGKPAGASGEELLVFAADPGPADGARSK